MSSISRLHQIPAAELEAIFARRGTWVIDAEVLRPGDTAWQSLRTVAGGAWVLGVAVEGGTPDLPIGRIALTLRARGDGRTLAPGIAGEPLNRNASGVFAPLVYAGAHIRMRAGYAYDAVPAVMRHWTRGRINDVDWPDNDVVCDIVTPDYDLEERTWIEEDGEQRGAPDPGVPMQEEMAALLTRYAPWAPSLAVLPDAGFPDYADLGIGEYTTSWTQLAPLLRGWAQQYGAAFHFAYSATADDDVPTLYLPPRDKTEPDLVLGTADVLDVQTLKVSREYVRNRFVLDYPNRLTGKRERLVRNNAASETQFGRGFMPLTEADGSDIDTPAKAGRFLGYADNDLSQPPTTKIAVLPFCPWLSMHDVLEMAPDDTRFDFVTRWSITAQPRHVCSADGDWQTEVALRGGSPVGMYYAWFARRTPEVEAPEARLLDFREIRRDDSTVTFGWTRTPLVADVLVWVEVHPVPIPSDPWPQDGPPRIQCGAEDEFTLAIPEREHIAFVQVEPRTSSGAGGPIWRVQVFGTQPDIIDDVPPIVNPPTPQPEGVTLETVHGGACGSDFLRHRVTWEGEGLLYWWDTEARQWKRPPGANAAFSDPSPFEMDYAGGGWVLDEVAGVDTEIRYQVMRIGVGGANASKEVSITQKIRRCTTGGGGGGGGGGGEGDPTVTLASLIDRRSTGSCSVADVLVWNAAGFDPALHRLEYRLLSATGVPSSGWTPLTQVGEGEQVLDTHAGREAFREMPSAPGDYAVRYGAQVRVMRRTGESLLVLGMPHGIDYVVEPCPPPSGPPPGDGGGETDPL